MVCRKAYICILLLSFLCISCLHSRTSSQIYTVSKSVRINFGSAVLRISGRVSENLYPGSRYIAGKERYVDHYENPAIIEGTITKDEIKYLHAGEEYKFSVLPTEVVSINIQSLNETDVEISVFEYGKEKKYIIDGTNRVGLFIAFQNR